MNKIEDFRTYRAKMNQVILDEDDMFFKRFFNLYQHDLFFMPKM